MALPKILRHLIFAFVSVVGGWQLTYVIAALPMNMPRFVESFIRFFLSMTGTGSESLTNPEDIGTLALILYWFVATVCVGACMYGCFAWLDRKRSLSQANR